MAGSKRLQATARRRAAEAARSGVAWSDEELRVLRRLAGRHLTADELGDRMGRSGASIQNKAFSLRIRLGRPRKPREAWGPRDDAQLAVLAQGGITRRSASESMGRGEGILRAHVAKQGLEWKDPPRRAPRPRPRRALPPRDPRQTATELRWLADHGWSEGMAAIELDIATLEPGDSRENLASTGKSASGRSEESFRQGSSRTDPCRPDDVRGQSVVATVFIPRGPGPKRQSVQREAWAVRWPLF